MRKLLLSLLISLLAWPTLGAVTLYTNVKGYSLDNEGKLFSFTTLAVNDGKVIAAGGKELEQIHAGASQRDGRGRVMLPGLIDAHGHLLGLGFNLTQVDLRGSSNALNAVQKVSQYASSRPELQWILGRGWNQELWPERAFPTAAQLDEGVRHRPVWLRRIDGHAGWANSRALSIAGITKATLDPPGGKIERDANGNPTGVLIDNAMNLLEKHIPARGQASFARALKAAGEHLLAVGITSVHDAGVPNGQLQFFMAQAKQQKLPLRINAMVAATEPKLAELLDKGPFNGADDMLRIASVKVYGDGALGSRGAALLAPYEDDKGNTGLLVTPKQNLARLFDTVIGHGFQLNYHAIGDRANRLALDQFADTFSRVGGQALRHRVEHAQVVALEDIPRFKTLGIIPSMQPTHATSDMNMAQDRVGKSRLKGAYAWQRFLQQGSPLALGSDFPVELANPFYGLHAAVTRQDRNNKPMGGWLPEQRLSLEQALRGFTLDAAYAGHQEQILGTLTAGKWADFIVLDRDPFAIPSQDLWKVQVMETWIAGKRVFNRTSK